MINIFEVTETNKMVEKENLDVRTITLGISLLNCIDSDLDRLNEKIYNRIKHKKKTRFYRVVKRKWLRSVDITRFPRSGGNKK